MFVDKNTMSFVVLKNLEMTNMELRHVMQQLKIEEYLYYYFWKMSMIYC